MKRKRRIAALYKVGDAIRGSDPERRRAARQDLSRPLERVVFIRIHLCTPNAFARAIAASGAQVNI